MYIIFMFKTLFNDLRVFMIHMDKSVERIPIMNKLAKQLNTKIKLVSAVDGNLHADHPRQCATHFQIKCCKVRSNGEIGCVLSHLKIWKQMVDENIEYALIFEDDCAATTNIQYLEQIMSGEQSLVKNADIILLGALAYYGHANIENSNFYRIRIFDGSHALIITKATAVKCIEFYEAEKQKGYLYPVDGLYGNVNIKYNLNTIGIKHPRFIFCQDSSVESTIQRK
jgi:glycosyl transferase family 25